MISSVHADSIVIRVAGDNNYPPYEFVNEDGDYEGFNVDIIRAIAREAGMEIELVPMDWDDAVSALEKGEVDVVQGMTITDYRDLTFDFTDPIVVNAQSIFVRAETSFITDFNDLKGTRVAYQMGDVNFETLSQIEHVELVPMDNQPEAMNALMTGHVEAFVGNRLTGLYVIQSERLSDRIKLVGTPMRETEYAIAVADGNETLLQSLNTGLAAIKSNGIYDGIANKWFGEVFEDQTKYIRQLMLVLGVVFGTSMVGIALVVWLNQRLQKEVEKRTEELHQNHLLLEKNNRQKDNILESITSGIIVIDNQEKIIQYNTAARKILRERLKLGQEWKALRIAGIIDGTGYREALDGKTFTDTLILNTEREEKVHIQYGFIPIQGPNGNEGTILLINNFTNEKNLLDLLSQNDKLNSLSRLSAGIAHELKNPLNSISAYVKKLPDKWDDPEFKEYFLSVVPDEIKRLNILLMNILDYTKPSSSEPDYIELDDLFEEVDKLFRQKVVEKRVTFLSDAGGLICWADPNHIKQVLINLVMNSYEALPERGQISLVATPEKERVVIKVSDSGEGIPKSAIAKAFEPFYTSKSDGTGIGLAISRQLIVENSGEIMIESEEGKGTVVTVKLPKFAAN
jgi:polar amino acid transport system substrate-binding protein